MKSFFWFVCICFFGLQVFAQDRIRVVEAPVEVQVQPEAEALMNKIAEFCSNEDFRGYASCFVSKRLSFLRTKVRPSFVTKDLDMKVLQVVVESADENQMEFEARYLWDEGFGGQVVTADIVAKKENNEWKVESEKIIGTKRSEQNARETPVVFDRPNFPANNNLRVLAPGEPGWDPDSPKDMPQISGGCKDGVCFPIPQDNPLPPVRPQERPRPNARQNVPVLNPGDEDWDPDAPMDFFQVPNSCKNGSCKR